MFQALDGEGGLRNRVIAFTSPSSGEGVTYVVDMLARELAKQTRKRVLRVDAVALQSLADLIEPEHIARHCCEETDIPSLFTLAESGVSSRDLAMANSFTNWNSRPEYRATCVQALRSEFDYVLIDCPAISNSSDAMTFAPVVDGVAVVVKAGQTRRQQIHRSQQLLESAGGNALGFILNERQYPIPNWLYSRL